MSQETIEVRYRELTPMSRQMFEDGRSVNAGAAKGAYFFARRIRLRCDGEGDVCSKMLTAGPMSISRITTPRRFWGITIPRL